MISWLKGQIIKNWCSSSRKVAVIAVAGIGYEVQLLSKHMNSMDISIEQEIWIHQIEREDCTNLYGFIDIKQRDLFRKLITVNGIGAQIAIGLLDDLEVNQLVSAIEENDFNLLIKSQGVGKRIAERLVIELKNKLEQFTIQDNSISFNHNGQIPDQLLDYLDEIKSTLNSLGYLDKEIKDSINQIKIDDKYHLSLIDSLSPKEKTKLMDKHLKKILINLSQQST